MKVTLNPLTFLFFFLIPCLSFAQEQPEQEVPYEINKVHPSISIDKEKLATAKSLMDLNPHYQSEWVQDYVSVELSAKCGGKIKKADSKNDMLIQPQKELLAKADLGTDIAVKVRYLPKNDLKNNEVKEMNFTFIVNPDSDASYIGGVEQMKKYLQEHAIGNIPANSFQGWEMAAVKFTVDEEGQIIAPEIAWPSKDAALDALLLKTVAHMPCWKPAEYESGIKVKQEYALTVGNQESCAINVLNIRPLPPRKE